MHKSSQVVETRKSSRPTAPPPFPWHGWNDMRDEAIQYNTRHFSPQWHRIPRKCCRLGVPSSRSPKSSRLPPTSTSRLLPPPLPLHLYLPGMPLTLLLPARSSHPIRSSGARHSRTGGNKRKQLSREMQYSTVVSVEHDPGNHMCTCTAGYNMRKRSGNESELRGQDSRCYRQKPLSIEGM